MAYHRNDHAITEVDMFNWENKKSKNECSYEFFKVNNSYWDFHFMSMCLFVKEQIKQQ